MKTIAKLMCLLLLCFSAVAFAAGDRTGVISSMARIIRIDKIDEAIQQNRLPDSYTGSLVTEDGHVMAAAVPGLVGEDEHNGYKDEERIYYLVLFPVYETDKDGTHGVVNGIKAYRGFLHASDSDSNICYIKVPADKLPAPLSVKKNLQNTFESGNSVTAYGFEAPQFSPEEQLPAYNEILNFLTQNVNALSISPERMCFYSNKQEDRKYLMQYLSGFARDGSFSDAVGSRGQGRKFSHTIDIVDACGYGSVIIERGTASVIGICCNSNLKLATDSSVICGGADARNVPIHYASETKAPVPVWIWIAIGAVALILIVAVVLLVTKRRTPPVVVTGGAGETETVVAETKSRVIMVLKGEDGESYSITSQMVRDGAVLGRSSSVELQFSKSTISSRHARLCKVNGRPGIEDLDSKGGTRVNGKKITKGEPVSLHKDDVIKLADYSIKVKGA